ncbi:MAG: nitroreductase family protein [Rikenellaceae bacterium]
MIKEIFEHRSIRKFKSTPIAAEAMRAMIAAASRASTCGNMQVYSMVISQREELLDELSPCHFGQVKAMGAPCVVTVCADVNRFSQWCRQRGAEPEYDNFIWFLNGAIDGLLAAQNMILEAEANGLGICILGTTLYTADKIVEILALPKGVIPITTIVMGYPDQEPPLTDRLPLESIVHMERYEGYSEEKIDELWQEREQSAESAELKAINNKPTLAHIFTENRYKGEDNILFSKKYFDTLTEQGFFNH